MESTNILLPCKSGNMIEGVWLPASGKLDDLKIERYKLSYTLTECAHHLADNKFGITDGAVRASTDLRYKGGIVNILVLWVPEADRELKGLRYVSFKEALQDKTFGPIVKAHDGRMQRYRD